MSRDPAPFPVRIAACSPLLVWACYLVETLFLHSMVLLPTHLIILTVTALVYSLLLFGWQGLVYAVLRKWVHRKWLWTLLFLLPLAVFVAVTLRLPLARFRIDDVIKDGRLAKLPSPASEIRFHEWESYFSGEMYATFKSTKEGIDKFVRESPSLAGAKPADYEPDSRRMHSSGSVVLRMAPSWFRAETPGRGKVYEIPKDNGGHNNGQVIVDEDENRVYIRVVWG